MRKPTKIHLKKRYTADTQKHVHGVIIFKEYNSNIYQILSFTPFAVTEIMFQLLMTGYKTYNTISFKPIQQQFRTQLQASYW